jgi:hypothetical protein
MSWKSEDLKDTQGAKLNCSDAIIKRKIVKSCFESYLQTQLQLLHIPSTAMATIHIGKNPVEMSVPLGALC